MAVPSEPDQLQRQAAETLASDLGIPIEQAMAGLAFQGRAMAVLDDVDRALGDASGDSWFDWSDGRGRLKIGVTVRVDSGQVDAAMRILRNAGLSDHAEVVKVVWSTRELEAAQERANALLESLGDVPWSTGRDPEANCVTIDVPDELTAEQLNVVEAAIRACGVSVRVATGAGWARLAGE
jgi:hypothetical protein